MKTYEIQFTGRTINAIGKFYPIRAQVFAADPEAAKLKLYERFDHITGATVKEIKLTAKNKYRNPWHKDLNRPKPEFYENDAPMFFEHRGVQVFKLAPKSFDYVRQGVCITQRAGARDPQELIDAILDRRQPISDQVKAIFPELLSWDEVPETKNQKGKNAKE